MPQEELPLTSGQLQKSVRIRTTKRRLTFIERLRRLRGRKLLLSLLFGLSSVSVSRVAVGQLPTGGDVVAGAAAIASQGNTLNVNASTSRTIVNWNAFNIGAGNTANFNLPDTNSAILNRVLTSEMPSVINGVLNSNGHVYLVNPSGIIVGSTGVVNTNAFVASTFDITNSEFMAGGPLTLTNNGSQAAIANAGTINTAEGGAHLIANQILNSGTVTSDGGNVTFSGGGTVQLANGMTYMQSSIETLASGISPTAGLIQNTGTIRATGAAKAGGEVYLVNPKGKILHEGTIQSKVVRNESNTPTGAKSSEATSTTGGRVRLEADEIALNNRSKIDASGSHGGGQVLIGGDWQGSGEMTQATKVAMAAGAVIDASATQAGDGGKIVLWSDVHDPNSVTNFFGTLLARGGRQAGNGGQIETSGHVVNLDGGQINAGAVAGRGGLWLIDPYNYTINSTAATNIVNTLNTGTSVTVTTAISNTSLGGSTNSGDVGDITVASNIITGAMTGDATLTLQAHRNIVINDGISIDATQNSNTRKLNVVLWADQDSSSGGAIRIGTSGGSVNNLKTNGGGIWMGGGSGTTSWTPYSGASTITVGASEALGHSGTGSYTNGVEIIDSSLVTAGGNFYASGKSMKDDLTSDIAYGTNISASTINASTGSLTLSGLVANDGTTTIATAVGLHIHGASTLSTTDGTISLTGTLNSSSRFTNGAAVWIGTTIGSGSATGSTTVSSGSGGITITGSGADSAGSGYRHGVALFGNAGSDIVTVSSTSGDVTLIGSAAYSATTTDTSGIYLLSSNY